MAGSKVAIISAVRTAVGKFQGSLQTFTAPQLGALVVREAVRRAGVEPAQVDDCIMGCVLQAGLGQNPARQAAIYGGLPPEVGALTVNQVCGSGLRAVSLASAGYPDRRRADRRRGWHGVDEQCALSAATGTDRLSHGQLDDSST